MFIHREKHFLLNIFKHLVVMVSLNQQALGLKINLLSTFFFVILVDALKLGLRFYYFALDTIY